MEKIILFSFFNSNNIGDKVIAELFYNNLSKKYNVVRCSNEGSFNICNRYVPEHLPLLEKIKNRICRYTNKTYRSPRYKQFLKEYQEQIQDSKAIVIGGGNILMDYSKKTASYMKFEEYIRLAYKKQKACYAFSIGIGPFCTEKQLHKAVSLLNCCKYISFRDQYSYELFIDNGGIREIANVGIDPVFSLRDNGKERSIIDTIAINIINPHWSGQEYQRKIMRAYCKLVKLVAQKYPHRRVVLFATELNDQNMVEEIYFENKLFENVFKEEEITLQSIESIYRRAQVVIGARMHSLIIAYSNRVPVIGLVWTSKVREFFEIIGKSERCIQIEELDKRCNDILEMINAQEEEWCFDNLIDKAKQMMLRDLEVIV